MQDIKSLSYRRSTLRFHVKRGFDVLFSICVLALGLPVFCLIALFVKLTSRGPVFYACERMGQHGRIIYCYKFRTMVVDAKERLKNLLATNPARQKEWELYRKLRNDPRITSIGHFLRKTSLDELPQFLNVLKGDMSVVGPRPPIPEEVVNVFKERAKTILSVKPGITGRWQVSERNECTLLERAIIEERYALEWSLFEDLQIVFKTIPVMISRKGN